MGSRSKVKEKRLYMPEDSLILSEIAVLSGNYMYSKYFKLRDSASSPGGRGVLPYMGYIGMCRGIGYVF